MSTNGSSTLPNSSSSTTNVSPSSLNQSSPTVPSATSVSGSPTVPLPVQGLIPVQGSFPIPATSNLNPSIDLLMMNSPSLIRRTLHRHDDTVVASASNYEESMLKQIQPKQKTVE